MTKTTISLVAALTLGACAGDDQGEDTFNYGDADTDTDSDTDTDTDTDTDAGPSIGAIQAGNIGEGETITLEGVTVASANIGYGFFISDDSGDGLWVYYGSSKDDVMAVEGDEITITGMVAEYVTGDESTGSLTELDVSDAANVMVTGTGTLPEPAIVDLATLTDDGSAEAYESRLVTVNGLTVTNADLGYGEIEMNGVFSVDDLFYGPDEGRDIAEGDSFSSITGFVYYHYGAFKLEPRDGGDFAQ